LRRLRAERIIRHPAAAEAALKRGDSILKEIHMRSVQVLTLAVAALLVALFPLPSHAQVQPVGVVTTLTGRADVTRATLSQPLLLKFKDDVFERDRIATAEKSIVRVLLGGKAIVTVRELSVLTITEEPGRATIDLTSGKIAVAVAKQRMRPGETLDVRTPNVVAAVRGTVFVVETHHVGSSQASGSGPAGSFVTTVDVKPPQNPQAAPDIVTVTAGGQTRDVPGGSGINAIGNTLGQLRAWNPTALVTGLTTEPGTGGPAPDAAFMPSIDKGTDQAAFLSTAILGGPTIVQPATVDRTVVRAPVNQLCCTAPIAPPSPTPPSPLPTSGLIVNGGFETGNFNGWTRSGNLGFTSVVSSPFYVRSGSFGAFLGPIGSDGFLSQTLETVVGKPYIVSFSIRSDGGFPNDFNGSWAGETFFSQTNMPLGEWIPLSFTEIGTGPSTVLRFGFRNDPGFLGLDDVSVITDPPLYFLGSGDTLTRTGTEPLLRLSGTPQTFDSLMIVCCGGRASLAGPLLQATNSDLTVPFSLVSVIQGGSLVSTSTDPLVQLLGGTHSFGSMGLPMFDVAGAKTATDPETGLTLGTDQPLQIAGSLLDASQATINAHQAVRVDAALLEASAPLLALRNGSQFTSGTDAVQLSFQAKVTSLGSVVQLDRSALTVSRGAALNIAGGSLLRVTGDLFSLTNGSTLSVLSGPLVSLSGGSILSVNGALIGFGGTGGNLVSVANNLCPCTAIGGIPVSLTGGALTSNVSIAGAIKNGNLGSLNLAPNSAVIRVDGAGTKVTINGM
jgi:hypothetical protein